MADYTSTYTGEQIDAAVAAVAGMTALTNAEIDTIWHNAMVTLISFTINGDSYQAEEGMTWQEWVNSDYNVNDNFYISGNYIYRRSPSGAVSTATPSSLIQENSNYTVDR